MMKVLFALVAVASVSPLLDGCGAPCTNGACQGQVQHPLATAMPATFTNFYGLEFILPDSAEVSFIVNPASTTSPDTWNVGLFTPAEWTSYQTGSGTEATAAIHNSVTSASDSAILPAGDWYLGFKCTNIIQNCMIAFDLTATY